MRAGHVAILALAGVLLAGGHARAQTSQGSGLTIESVSSPAPGAVQVLIDPDAAIDGAIGAQPNAGDFTVWLADGAAPGLTVTRNGARGKPLTTVLLVDESGSYKAGHGNKVARPTIGTYINGAAGDELALVLFAGDVQAFPVHTRSADLVAELATLATRKARGVTSVTNGVEAAVELAIKEGEPGLREVVVFTDGGHEALLAADSWPKLIDRATGAGVRVSVVVPTTDAPPAGTSHTNYATTIEGLQKLTRDTGGLYLKTDDPAFAAAQLAAARTELKSWLALEGKLCGLQRGKPVEVRVEYVPNHQRKAWSAGATLASSAYAPGSDVACPSLCETACAAWQECLGGKCMARQCSASMACPAGATCTGGTCEQACSESCAAWQECKGGGCVAKTCTADEVCGPGSHCASGACAKPAGKGTDPLVWILAGAGALLLLVALAVLLRRKKPAPPPVVVPFFEPPPPPPPVEEPAAPPLVAAPELDPLPETHLVAIGGWATPGERWRLNQRRTVAGASADPADGVDLRFAIKQVSGKHAAFELYPSGDLWVSDLGSSNGTYVNGRRLVGKERAKLSVGDQVKLSQQLILVVERPSVTAEPRPVETAAPAAEAPRADAAPAKKAKQVTKFDPGDR